MTTFLTPLRYRDFRWLTTARTIDYLGNGMAPIALAFAVLDLTHSAAALGIVVGARSIANVALLLFGGMLADRLPRKAVMTGSATLAAITQGIAAWSVIGGFSSLPLLAILGVVNGAAAAAAMPAAAAMTPSTVPAPVLRQANALIRIGMFSALIAGASLGSLVVAVAGPGVALAVDAMSFAVVALCFAAVRSQGSTNRSDSKPWQDLWEGWTEFTKRTWVWVIVLQFLVINAVYAGTIQVLGPVMADSTIGRASWGLIMAARMAGSVVGGLLAARWQPKYALRFGVLFSLCEAIPILAFGVGADLGVLLIAMFISGAAIEQFAIAWEVSLQQDIPERSLARVYSYDMVGSSVAIPLGQIAAGPAAAAIGTSQVFQVGALMIVSSTIAVLLVPSVRKLSVKDQNSHVELQSDEVVDAGPRPAI